MSEQAEPAPGNRQRDRPRELGHALGATAVVAAVPLVVLVLLGSYLAIEHRPAVVRAVVRPGALMAISVALGFGWLLWMSLIWATYLRNRPSPATPQVRAAGILAVALICTVITVPMAVGVRYAAAQRDAITTVFSNEVTATAPQVTVDDPWGGRARVNVLLLGGDGAVTRPGIRTDTVMVASISVRTGSTILFSLPRNLQRVPFPRGSALHAVYPEGFTGSGDPAEYLLNAVYQNVPAAYPGINGRSDNEGADAVKQAVSGALGITVDYYALVNLDGFEQIVDAIGGITVNINRPVPIGGDTSRGKEPDYWMQPGPDQRLNGFHALWFARGRYGSSDYDRMERQRCAIHAIVNEARPLNLLRRYTALAEAGKTLLRTDIPLRLLPEFAALALKVKDAPLTGVGFERSRSFDPNDPDYAYLQRRVAKVIHRQELRDAGKQIMGGGRKDEAEASDTADDCAYQPD